MYGETSDVFQSLLPRTMAGHPCTCFPYLELFDAVLMFLHASQDTNIIHALDTIAEAEWGPIHTGRIREKAIMIKENLLQSYYAQNNEKVAQPDLTTVAHRQLC